MKRDLRSFNFRFWPYFITLAIVITIIMLSFYFSAFDRIRNSIFGDDVKIAEKTASQITSYLSELDILAEQVKLQPSVINKFLELSNNHDQQNHFETNILDSIDISSTLKKLIVKNIENIGIVIYNNNGDFVSSHEYSIDKENLSATLKQSNYHATLARIEQAGGRLIRYNRTNKWTGAENSRIVVIKPLMNNYSGEICGIIEVSRNALIVESGLELISTPGASICLRNRYDNSVLYPHEYSSPEKIEFRASYPVGNGEWEIVIEQTDPITHFQRIQLFIVLAIVYLVLIFFMLYIAHYFEVRINRPISEFTEYVKSLKDTEVKSHTVDNKAIDEIKTLSESFDEMLSRLNSSLEREKNAYALALQAQMNPHFLYNTLAVIGSEGAESGCDSVADMCAMLSDMLRYVTSYQKTSVSLSEEIEHTKNYLSLMKCRYEDYFTYSISVAPELNNISVPKLFIQPLAENCFKHGFKKKSPPWHIDIKIDGTADNCSLVITDNGVGISEDAIKAINASIKKSEQGDYPKGIGGLGIAGTIIRTRTLFYHNTSYKLENLDGKGTRITIASQKKENAKNV